MRIVRSVRIKQGPRRTVDVVLPSNATPLRFIKQGLFGLYLWYTEDGEADGVSTFRFHFIGKDEAADSGWRWMQDVKYSKYWMVFQE